MRALLLALLLFLLPAATLLPAIAQDATEPVSGIEHIDTRSDGAMGFGHNFSLN